ncbi:NAD(P)H-dependent flavin oxidoreductase [Streptomyces sp. BE303]|uniref:NAD(P)H-dependent flavin oxidoreductase n=1 Tax=Streptomyces sp. BE303 TaxID=3002528 RepID=UPI002E788A3E|nr:nitronate monooxygenase [Streptomyces sp. BE303]MED7948522.1 nitronate monooxygenase [Streptomyces sp. BE303]
MASTHFLSWPSERRSNYGLSAKAGRPEPGTENPGGRAGDPPPEEFRAGRRTVFTGRSTGRSTSRSVVVHVVPDDVQAAVPSATPTFELGAGEVVISTKLTELLGIDHPIVSAPMGGVSGGRLAAAVTRAGGLGLVGVSYGDAAFIDEHLPQAAEGGGVWGAGCVMFTFDERPGLWDKVLGYAPPVIALSFGDAEQVGRYVSSAAGSGARVVVQVHDTEQAVVALQAGASVLVVQGAEAGGHHKTRATLPLVPAVLDLVRGAVPVVAAGGFADGRGLAAALALGADGVMMGTRFALTVESIATAGFKTSLTAAGTTDTVNTRSFDVLRGIPWDEVYQARSVSNAFTREWTGRDDDLAARRADVEPGWTAAVARDDVSQRALFAGEVLDLVKDVRTAAAIVEDTVSEAETVLRGLATRIGR